MLLKLGDTVLIGRAHTTKSYRTAEGQKDVEIERCFIPTGTLASFDIDRFFITVAFADYNLTWVFPLSYGPLDIGVLGVEGFRHPKYLPYAHPYHLSDIDEQNFVTVRRTNQKYRLQLDPQFDDNGKFFLIPKQGDATLSTVSTKWNHKELHQHLKELVGKPLIGKATVYRLTIDGQHFPDSIDLTSTRASRAMTPPALVYLLFDNGSVASVPLALIKWTKKE